MTADQIIRDVALLYDEKGLECTAESIRLVLGICRNLDRRGITPSRELLDFAIDVVRAKSLAGFSGEDSEDGTDAAKEKMIEWLEAMGWRRDWFTRPLAGAW